MKGLVGGFCVIAHRLRKCVPLLGLLICDLQLSMQFVDALLHDILMLLGMSGGASVR